MGSELMMIPEKGEMSKIKYFLNLGNTDSGDDDEDFPGPIVNKVFPRFWTKWRGNRLDLCYTLARGNSELALAFAKELCKYFKFKKIGWSSVGKYIPVKEFMKCRPYSDEIFEFRRTIYFKRRSQFISQYINDIKTAQREYEGWARRLCRCFKKLCSHN